MASVVGTFTIDSRARRAAAKRRTRGEGATAWAFVSPSVLIILGLSVVPVLWSLLLSFQANDLVSPSRWVGFANYRALSADPAFKAAVEHTLVYTALYVPLSVIGGLGIALMLDRMIRFISLYRTLVFVPFVAWLMRERPEDLGLAVPFVVSAAAQGVLFSFVLDPEFGAANSLLHKLGLPAQGFFSDPGQALYLLVAISLWSGTGFCVIVYLAALQGVPGELVEAARIDGAGRFGVLRYVVFPTLTPVTVFLVLFQTINALQVFDLVFVTTKGGPLGSTTVIVYFIWEKAFKAFTAGYSAAAAYALAVALLLAGLALQLYQRRRAAR